MLKWLKNVFKRPVNPIDTDVLDSDKQQTPAYNTKVVLVQDPKETAAEKPKTPHIIETDFFQIVLDETWDEVLGYYPEQVSFDNHHLGIGFVLSTIRADTPLGKLEACAQQLASSFASGADEAYAQENVEIEKVGQTIERMSWGYQVDIVSKTQTKKYIRSMGFVGPALILNLTFTQSSAAMEVFDDEIGKILSTLKFADKMWAGQPFPQEPTFH